MDEEPAIERADDEMDVSDEEETPRKRLRDSLIEEKNQLRDENDSLRCQMEAYKNEAKIILQTKTGILINFLGGSDKIRLKKGTRRQRKTI